jgi:hypothetical protein
MPEDDVVYVDSYGGCGFPQTFSEISGFTAQTA